MEEKDKSPNPFESPTTIERNPFHEHPSDREADGRSVDAKNFEEIGRAFIAWERLRAVYNIALAVLAIPLSILVVIASNDKLDVSLQLIEVCIVGAIVANLCFLLGHYITAWMLIFGFKSRVVIVVLFWCGVGISVPLVFVAIGSAIQSF